MLAACLPLKRRNISLLHKLLAAEIPLWWYFEMYLKCNEGNGSGHIPDKEEMEQKCSPQIELPVTISSSSHHPFFLIWWHSHDQHITSDMSRRATNSVIATKMASSPCFSLHLSLKEEQPAQSKSQSIRGNTRNTQIPKNAQISGKNTDSWKYKTLQQIQKYRFWQMKERAILQNPNHNSNRKESGSKFSFFAFHGAGDGAIPQNHNPS